MLSGAILQISDKTNILFSSFNLIDLILCTLTHCHTFLKTLLMHLPFLYDKISAVKTAYHGKIIFNKLSTFADKLG